MTVLRRWLVILTAIAGGVSSSASCASSNATPVQAAVNVDIEDAGRAAPMRVDEASAPAATADAAGGNYTGNAATEFAAAEALFRARRLTEASAAYAEVTRKYHYSRYAQRAELRIADILFERGELSAAATTYDKWVRDHRSEQDVPAVLRRAAVARCRVADAGPCFDDYDAGL